MDRRDLIGGSLSLVAATSLPPSDSGAKSRQEGLLSVHGAAWQHLRWARGLEGERRADLGNGQFLNPVFSGDHPDPALIRVGEVFYLTFSSFEAYPGLLIWQSRDLINWTPVTAALRTYIGSVWAPALAHHDGRFYLYIPARTADYRSIYVIHADRIDGPWSEPIDLRLPAHIDPDHVVDEDGQRWLFLSGGDRVALSPDGLSTRAGVEHIYDPWRYPESWTVESFSPEGPKITRRGEYWYMITAVGGTVGPPTGHMVIVARAKTLAGPWQDCPHNPIVRTWSAAEKWWSRGHATLIEAPDGRWWMAYHGYENGFWTLGRQMLLDPVRWTADGWPAAIGGDLSRPLLKPVRLGAAQHGLGRSDRFADLALGTRWTFYEPSRDEANRLALRPDGLSMTAKGNSPADASPLCVTAGDLAYMIECAITRENGAEAGLLLFYSKRLYVGVGFDDQGLILHRYGRQRRIRRATKPSERLYLRIRNDRHIVTIYLSIDGQTWEKFPVQMEVSGYHHNTDGDFLSLRPALYTCKAGSATFHHFCYRGLETG